MAKDTDRSMMLNKSHVREFANKRGKNISQGAIDNLSGLIRKRLLTAIERMGSRKTIYYDDVM